MGEVHARIPMRTGDEIRALQRENAEADERVWRALQEDAGGTSGGQPPACRFRRADRSRSPDRGRQSANAEAAADRVERLKRGEAVAGGLGEPVDVECVFREAGWTAIAFDDGSGSR
jgi:hypothetical protein